MEWFRPNAEQHKTYEVKPEEQVLASGEDNRWVVGQLPPGFRKVKQVMRTLPGRQQPVRHMVFCDGLASVSLFIEPVGRHHPRGGTLVQGATNVVSKTIADYQVVVLGEVPSATLQQIVNSVTAK
jgi:sigma-E factor negative regulatory protein RseB